MRSFITVFAIIILAVGSARAELASATPAAVNQALASGRPTLIDFGLRTCGVCKRMAPFLESLAIEYQGKANILFVDVRVDQTTARKFNVQMLPTQIFIDPQGKEAGRHTGFMSRLDIIKGLKSAGLK